LPGNGISRYRNSGQRYTPDARQEEIDVIHFVHLLEEHREIFQERRMIVLYQRVQIDPVLPAGQEGFSITPPAVPRRWSLHQREMS
jgi:hypothetical protein